MKYYKEIDELIADIEDKERRIKQAKLNKQYYEMASAIISMCVIICAGGLLYAVSGAWRSDV